MEFSAVNRRHPSRETPLGPGAKTDGCFRRLYYIPSLIGRHCNLFPKDLNKFVFEIWLVHSGTKTIKISSTFLHESSVLTRILPWGVAGPPLQKKRGPSRMLEGQRLKVTLGPWRTCKKSFVVPRGTNNLSPHSERYLTWSTYLIKHGGQDVYHRLYDLIEMLTQTFTAYMWPTRLNAIKVKALSFLVNVFIHLNKQNAGMFDWPLNYSFQWESPLDSKLAPVP